MRTVASVAVPTTTPVRYDLKGTYDVGGIIFFNASPSTLTVATLDGQQSTCPANYWIKILPSAAHPFDGALLVTAQTQIASTAQSASMWADVYAPGESMPAGDSGPLPNQMTGGNQQPRVIALPPDAYYSISGNLAFTTAPQTIGIVTLIAFAPATQVIPRVYFASLSAFVASVQASQILCVLGIQLYQANGTTPVGSFNPIWQAVVTSGSAPTIAQPCIPMTPTGNQLAGGGIIAKVSPAVFYSLELHVTALFNPSSLTNNLEYSILADFDAQSATAIPSEGGGVSAVTPLNLYSGVTY